MDGYITKLNKDIEIDITETERTTTDYNIKIYDKTERHEVILTRSEFKSLIDFMTRIYNGEES